MFYCLTNVIKTTKNANFYSPKCDYSNSDRVNSDSSNIDGNNSESCVVTVAADELFSGQLFAMSHYVFIESTHWADSI